MRRTPLHRRVPAILATTAVLLGAAGAVQAACGGCGDVGTVVAAVFAGASCDCNGDGRTTVADAIDVVRISGFPPTSTRTPSATITPTPTTTGSATNTPSVTTTPTITLTPSATETPTITLTPTASKTATQTGTPTMPACPTAVGDLSVEIDNQTGVSPITVRLTGARLADDCVAGPLATHYDVTMACEGSGVAVCGGVPALAPGVWRQSLRLVAPDTGQQQHQTGHVLGGAALNRVRFTAFRSVLTVTTTAHSGDGSLRSALQAAGAAAKPLLIQFAPQAFPPGGAATIDLEFALPALDSDDVTIDGTDPDGAIGNRVVDGGGMRVPPQGIPVLVIHGARNRVTGLRLRNAGVGDRDVLSISGAGADANLIDRCIIEGAVSGDGIGVDGGAGTGFDDTVNVIRDCEITGAADKGVKVTTDAHARVEHCWVHDNANGGIQATLGGHVQAWYNLVERNRGSSAQNGLSVQGSSGDAALSELETRGNISRGNGANGVSVRARSQAVLRHDYAAQNGSSGIRIFNDIGEPATAAVEGSSAVCNAVDGAVVANSSVADFGGGPLGSLGNNAFAQNNLPAGGANFRNATGLPVAAANNQWENCGRGETCDEAEIARLDVTNTVPDTTAFAPAQAHRSGQPPVLEAAVPTAGQEGGLLRIFGSGFNVIDGHFSEKDNQCADVVGRNRCVPLRGNCVRIGGVRAPVEAVTPTMLVVRWPFTCIEPVPLVVTTDQGPSGATSAPITVCTGAE